MHEVFKEKVRPVVTTALLGYQLLFLGVQSAEAQPSPDPLSLAAVLQQDINHYRQEVGLSPLTNNEKLDQIAQEGTQDMSDKNYRSHTSPTGETIFTRLEENNISYEQVGEIIAWNGYSSEESEKVAFKALIENKPHKDVIVDKYTEIGTGSVVAQDGTEIYEAILLNPENNSSQTQEPYVGKGPYVE